MERRRTFSREFKLEAVKLVTERGVSVAPAAKDLGVHENVLRKWVRELREVPQEAFPGNGKQTAQDAEIARLRRELAKLKIERDSLKKATPTSRRSRCEIRLRGETQRGMAGQSDVRGARCLARRLLRWLVRPRSRRSLDDEKLGAQVHQSFVRSDRTYGARRVWRDVLERASLVACTASSGSCASRLFVHVPVAVAHPRTGASAVRLPTTCWTASSRPMHRPRNGWPISPTSGRPKAGCT